VARIVPIRKSRVMRNRLTNTINLSSRTVKREKRYVKLGKISFV
jgi:hypothetical protein